jgi:hypothetical protein
MTALVVCTDKTKGDEQERIDTMIPGIMKDGEPSITTLVEVMDR